ncbi:MAG: hypothetical protein M1839_002523 [Geoglossum umbratile]|nr:MAG: hypothetical protein M1839_002523 [Geoglossum umbratile]
MPPPAHFELQRREGQESDSSSRDFTKAKPPRLIRILWNILKQAATDPEAGQIICVLDALDECELPARKVLVKELGNFYSAQHNANTRLKFLSFPYSIKDLSSISLKGEEESDKISNEINLVIEDQIPRLSNIFEYPPKSETQEAIVQHLKRMKHRTYFWLHLILDVIRDTQESAKGRPQMLTDRIPDSVDKAYEGTSTRVKHPDRIHTRKLLRTTVAATRPLTGSDAAVGTPRSSNY